MEFGSVEECESYIIQCSGVACEQTAQEVKKDGSNIIKSQVGGITGHLGESVKVMESHPFGFTVEIYDDGYTSDYSWASVGYSRSDARYGQHFFPMYGLESGGTWGRGATSIMPEWIANSKNTIDTVWVNSMRSQGVPIG